MSMLALYTMFLLQDLLIPYVSDNAGPHAFHKTGLAYCIPNQLQGNLLCHLFYRLQKVDESYFMYV